MNPTLASTIALYISRFGVLIIAFTFHELAHAWTADQFGDDTPRLNGRLTLNPLAHLDPIGSLLLLVAGFGWAKPVPINPYVLQRRSPAAVMWVSLAGPFSNFIMAILGAVPLKLMIDANNPVFFQQNGFLPSPVQFLSAFVTINLVLMLFNLIPLAPLDGDKIAEYFFPPSLAHFWDQIRPYGPMILLLLVFSGNLLGFNILGAIIDPPMNALLKLMGLR